MNRPLRIAITGAGGQIGYSLLFRIASGSLLGPDQPIILQLFDVTAALPVVRGVVMELEDGAFPLLHGIDLSDDPRRAFRDVDMAFLIGSRPRTKGMERKDLLLINGVIFKAQGRALSEVAQRNVKVLVVGNPANTNGLIALLNAPDLTPDNFTTMMRLDHNRALAQVAMKLGCPVRELKRMTVWGNHSTRQFPDLTHSTHQGKSVRESLRDDTWVETNFIPTVQNRGAAVIVARGLSSAASAANAAICHMRDWVQGTPADDWVTMGVYSRGQYGIPEGIMFGMPVVSRDGRIEVVEGLAIDPAGRARIEGNCQELLEERAATAALPEL